MEKELFEFQVNCVSVKTDYIIFQDDLTSDDLSIEVHEGKRVSIVMISRYDVQRLCKLLVKWLNKPQNEASGTGQANV